MIFVAPDTSPRREGVPDDPEGAYDFGLGAGFYVDATEKSFVRNYRMWAYITQELPELVAANLPIDERRQSIMGHSMGGHGALTIALRNPDRSRSVSAFLPIVAPSQVPWGRKALGVIWDWIRPPGVLTTRSRSSRTGRGSAISLSTREAPNAFLTEQLRRSLLAEACANANIPLTLRLPPAYDHSYYLISSFMEDHLRWHAARLK